MPKLVSATIHKIHRLVSLSRFNYNYNYSKYSLSLAVTHCHTMSLTHIVWRLEASRENATLPRVFVVVADSTDDKRAEEKQHLIGPRDEHVTRRVIAAKPATKRIWLRIIFLPYLGRILLCTCRWYRPYACMHACMHACCTPLHYQVR